MSRHAHGERRASPVYRFCRVAPTHSAEIEEENVAATRDGSDGEICRFGESGAVATLELLTVDLDHAIDDLNPDMTSLCHPVRELAAGRQMGSKERHVLVDGKGPFATVARGHQDPGVLEFFELKGALFVPRVETGALGFDPDLEESDLFAR